jgi:DNA-binding MarR family transcriptional regulator
MIRPTEEEAEYNIIVAALTPKQVRAVTLIKLGYRKSDIAKKSGCSRSTITRLFKQLSACLYGEK